MVFSEMILSILAFLLSTTGDDQFPAAHRRAELSEQFVKVMSHPSDYPARLRLVGLLEEESLPLEATLLRRSLTAGTDMHDTSRSQECRESGDAAERQYSILCSFHRGMTREESRKRLDDARAESKSLARDSVNKPCQVKYNAEASIERIGFECPLVGEWAYATILCYSSDGADVEQDLELAFRSLLELETRGFRPNATPTSTDLLFFVARATSQIGDQKLAIVLAESSLQDYPSDEEVSSTGLLVPSASRQEIEAFIAKARSAPAAGSETGTRSGDLGKLW